MRPLTLLSVLLLVTALFVCHTSSTAIPGANVVHFIEGFVEGLQREATGNITKCVEAKNASLHDLETGFDLLDEGLKGLHPAMVEKGLSDIGRGIQEIAEVLELCGANELAEDIARIGREIEEGRILEVVLKEVINIIHHEKVLTEDFKDSSKAWHAKDYKTSGFYLGKIVGILLKD